MPIVFPPIETASPEGLLAIGGNLDVETLLTAYSQGIFPWPISTDSPLTWFSPDPRGVFFIKDLHLSKSFIKFLKNNTFEVKFNTNFEAVLRNCGSAPRKHEEGTWITQEIVNGYNCLFDAGHAYSVEVYNGEELIGGLYGVSIGNYVTGESMFHKESNASKLALYALICTLKKNNILWLDTQMVTPVIESMGGREIDRKLFLKELNKVIDIENSRDHLFKTNFSKLDPLF
jgi:leucyl/phenylalanyl-tRNA--protein transferase